jgi:hypothetical protein
MVVLRGFLQKLDVDFCCQLPVAVDGFCPQAILVVNSQALQSLAQVL